MKRTQPLRETGWTLHPVDPAAGPRPVGVINARAPGCVHDALLDAGIIADPLRGANEADACWVGETDWIYATRFRLDAKNDARHDAGHDAGHDAERVELVCAGLDSVAALFVDGIKIGSAASAHVRHRFDLSALDRTSEHELAVHFRGPLAVAHAEERTRGPRPVNGDWGPYAYVRKPACHFGWDWGPQLPTAGFWTAPKIESWSGARIDQVRPLVRSVTPHLATVDVLVDLACAAPGARRVTVCLIRPDGRVIKAEAAVETGASTARVPISVPEPERWWPAGYGDQPLHELSVTLEGDGGLLDRWSDAIGLRTVRLDTNADSHGTAFALEVNGQPIFAQGANWIPVGLFPRADDAARTRSLLAAARAANMNMIRVWGGGRYEDHDFYRACDRAGLLVWQDFMFACATYPEEPPFSELIEREAREQVARLSRHPSVCLWCGGNENILAYRNWDGWRDALREDQTWGRHYWLEMLPRITAEVDPTRPYWPDSPYAGDETRDPNDPDHGDRHTWDLRFDEVRTLVPRFVSEFGHQAPPALATWRAAEDAPFALDGAASRRRQRAWGKNEREFVEPLQRWFRRGPDDPSAHGLAQILQARSMGLAFEWLRCHRPRCMGALIWQLNDVWAGPSWSLVDVAGRRKPAWYAVRRALAPRLLSVHPIDGTPTLFAVNDTDESWRATGRARRLDSGGQERAVMTVGIDVAPRTAAAIAPLAALPFDDERREVIVVDDGVWRRDPPGVLPAFWIPEAPPALRADPPPAFDADLEHRGDETHLTVHARTLLRDVVISADAIDPAATIAEHAITLVPGESYTYRIRGAMHATLAELTSAPVFTAASPLAGSRDGP